MESLILTLAETIAERIKKSLLLSYTIEDGTHTFQWLRSEDLFETVVEISDDGGTVNMQSSEDESGTLEELVELLFYIASDPNLLNEVTISYAKDGDRLTTNVVSLDILKSWLLDVNPAYPVSIEICTPGTTHNFYSMAESIIAEWKPYGTFMKKAEEAEGITHKELIMKLNVDTYDEAIELLKKTEAK